MKRVILLLSIASFALAACTREPEARHIVTLPVDSGGSSKVFLDETFHTYWNAGDKVSIFYGGEPENICGTFQGEDGDAKGLVSFESSSSIPIGPTYALSPYNPSNSISGPVLTAEIPCSQPYEEGSYANGSAVLAAKSVDGHLSFRYANAVIALTLRLYSSLDVNVRSIVLRSQSGEPIAGKLNIDMGGDDAPKVSVGGSASNSIVMASATPGENICTIGAGRNKTFFFCVAPGALYEGYCFEVELEGGEVRKVRSSKKTVLSAGVLERIEDGIVVSDII